VLAAVVARVPEQCDILLDLKERSADRAARLVAALAATLAGQPRFIACGGLPGDLDALRGAGLRTWRSIGTGADLRAVLAGPALPDEAVSVRQSLLSREVVAVLHTRVPAVVAWTVNYPRRARQVRNFGVDGMTTDRLAVMHLVSSATH
jgi:glycerophosphoryl diester phosphodiesterase